jgi:hypothetical protein
MRADIERYKHQVARLDLTGIDFGAFRDEPLPAPVRRCLRYLHDAEHHTVCSLRDLLVPPARRDPDITTALTLWSYEELWHGEALGRVLAAHGEAAEPRRATPRRRRLGRRDRPALALVWTAVDEWTTQAAYARLASRAGHPVLTDLLNRIMRQEARHVALFAGEAEDRLTASRRAQRLCRRILRRRWRPTGADVLPPAELAFVTAELFGDADGRAAAQRLDRRIARLPGLSGLRLVEDAVTRSIAAAAAGLPTGGDDSCRAPRARSGRSGDVDRADAA